MLRTSLCIRTTPTPSPLHVPMWPLNAPRSKKVSSKGKTQASGRAPSPWQLIVMGLEGNVRQKMSWKDLHLDHLVNARKQIMGHGHRA